MRGCNDIDVIGISADDYAPGAPPVSADHHHLGKRCVLHLRRELSVTSYLKEDEDNDPDPLSSSPWRNPVVLGDGRMSWKMHNSVVGRSSGGE